MLNFSAEPEILLRPYRYKFILCVSPLSEGDQPRFGLSLLISSWMPVCNCAGPTMTESNPVSRSGQERELNHEDTTGMSWAVGVVSSSTRELCPGCAEAILLWPTVARSTMV